MGLFQLSELPGINSHWLLEKGEWRVVHVPLPSFSRSQWGQFILRQEDHHLGALVQERALWTMVPTLQEGTWQPFTVAAASGMNVSYHIYCCSKGKGSTQVRHAHQRAKDPSDVQNVYSESQ